MKKLLVVAVSAIALVASVSFAQDQNNNRANRPGGNFLRAARTEDGKIDLSKLPDQMPQQRKDAMKAADKDGDGFLSGDELRAAMPARGDRPNGDRPNGDRPNGDRPNGDRPNRNRANGDRPGAPGPGFGFGSAFNEGKLDLSKLPEQMAPEMKENFKKADKDNDGFLTPEEMRDMPRPEFNRQGFGANGFFGDAFKDGKIEIAKLPERFPEAQKEAFKKADKDNDGFLTMEEMRDMPRPKFRFPEGKKPDFINDDNAFDVAKVTEAIKGCDKNNDGVIDEEEQKAAADYIRENFGPSFNMFLQSVLGAQQPGFGFGFGGPQGGPQGGMRGFGPGFGGPQGGPGFGPGFGGPQGGFGGPRNPR